jgi:hypothetical protein
METSDFRKALDTQRSHAIVLSALHQDTDYTPPEVLAEIAATVRAHHGQSQTDRDWAAEYCGDMGDHEAVMAERQRWALALAASLPLTATLLTAPAPGRVA